MEWNYEKKSPLNVDMYVRDMFSLGAKFTYTTIWIYRTERKIGKEVYWVYRTTSPNTNTTEWRTKIVSMWMWAVYIVCILYPNIHSIFKSYTNSLLCELSVVKKRERERRALNSLLVPYTHRNSHKHRF